MSLFKKKRIANIRERITAFDDEEEDGNGIDDLQLASTKSGISTFIKKDKKKCKSRDDKKLAVNALSFEDELEGRNFF